MAGTSDGSITIDTKLDNTGFSKGSKELLDAIQSLINHIDALTKQMTALGIAIQNAFSGGMAGAVHTADEISKGADDVVKSTADYEKAVSDFAKICESFDGADTFEEAYQILEKLQNHIAEFANTRYSINGKEILGSATEVFPQMQEAYTTLHGLLNELHGDAGEGQKDIDDYINAVEHFARTCESIDGASLSEAKAIILDLADQLARFANTEFNFDGETVMGRDTLPYQKMAESLQILQAELQNTANDSAWTDLQNRQKNLATLSGAVKSAFQGAFNTIRKAGTAAGTALVHSFQSLKGVLSSVATKAWSVASSIAGMGKTAILGGLKKLGSAISGMMKGSKNSGGFLGLNLKTLIQGGLIVRGLSALFGYIKNALKDGFTTLSGYDAELKNKISGFQAALNTLKNSLATAFAPIAQIVLPLLTSLINGLAEAISKVGQLVAALTGQKSYMKATAVQADTAASASDASKAMTKEKKAAKELKKELAGFDDVEILHDNSDTSSPDTGQTTGAGFETVPIEGNFADLAKKIKDAWENADFTEIGRMIGEKLKAALENISWSDIKATLRRIASSIATFLNGFLETPGLFSVIGKTIAEGINSAFEAVEAFVRDFHWGSLGTAIKDLILGVLDNIDWTLIYKTMGELGSGIGTAFENALNDPDLWSKIFTAFSHGIDALVIAIRGFLGAVGWGELGSNIGNGLKVGMRAIPWGEIYALASDFGTDLAAFLNGLVETPGLFEEIGQTISKGINAAFTAVGDFVSNFHWGSLGVKIKVSLLHTLKNLNWPLIYQTMKDLGSGIGTTLENALNDKKVWAAIFTAFANGIHALVHSFRSFLGSIGWESLGANIGSGLKDGMNAIPWEEIYALAGDFGTDLASFLNGLFTEDTFSELGSTVAKFINSGLEVLNSFGDTFEGDKFGESLAAGLNGFLGDLDTDKLSTGIDKLVTKIRDAIVSFLGNVSWYDFGAKLRDIIINLPWKALFIGFGMVIWSAINSVVKFFMGLFNTDNITSPFTSALNNLKSTIDTISEKIDFETLANGIESLVKALTPAVSGFAAGLLEVFNGLVEVGISFIQKLGPALQKIADAINSLPEGTLAKFGEELGKVAATFLVMSGASLAITNLQNLISGLGSLGTAGANAAAGTTAAAGGVATAAKATAEATSAYSGFGGALTGVSGIFEGFLGMLGGSAGVTAIFQDAINKFVIPQLNGTADAAKTAQEGFGLVAGAMSEAGIKGDHLGWTLTGITSPFTMLTNDVIPDFETTFTDVVTEFEEAGGDVDTLKVKLLNLLNQGAFSESQAKVISAYIGNIGSTAETTSTSVDKSSTSIEELGKTSQTSEKDTSAFAGVFDLFKDLSITTPLKMALIGAAIKLLGENGELSQDQAEKLEKALNDWKTEPTEENFQKVQTVLSETGVSAESLKNVFKEQLGLVETDTKTSLSNTVTTVRGFKKGFNDASEESGNAVGTGFDKGISNTEKTVKARAKGLGTGAVSALNEGLRSNSPSKETELVGGYFGEGFKIGIENSKEALTTTVQNLVQTLLNTANSYIDEFTTIGSTFISNLCSGISSYADSANTAITNLISGMYSTADDLDFTDIGTNIAIGIYNGLIAYSETLNTLAWNTAVDMYNSACAALGISSPSKKFAWIGEMMTAGLGEGLVDTQGTAIDAVKSLADAVIDEAEEAKPAMMISTPVDELTAGLDTVLTVFSDKVVGSFDTMLSAMEDIVNGSGFTIPAIASGSVMPYSARRASTQSQQDNYSAIADAIALRDSERLTRADLAEVLISVCRQYLDIDFYIGDEQIARHANAGNMKLNRRYSAITA